MENVKKRLNEIDALRGIAIVGMIVFHFFFDLDYLGIFHQSMFSGGWLVAARIAQFLFLGLAGVSVALSSRGLRGQASRGGRIFLAGMLVSFVTWIFAGDEFVKFGVLHFVGVAVVVASLYKRRPAVALFAAIASFILGEYFKTLTVSSHFLFPFGLTAAGFGSLDYFPIFPWLSVVLVGQVVGEFYVKKSRRQFGEVFLLSWMGRHSLAIYLVHQPILIGVLMGIKSIL